jgi:hypothetical protein
MNAWIRAAVCFQVLFAVACGESFCAEKVWAPPDSLVGTWEAGARVFGVKDAGTAADSVRISITIHKDGTVSGAVGGATLNGCRAASNRGRISRALNIRSEYIVHNGTLEGAVFPVDTETRRTFTIPFTIRDGVLKGSVMVTKPWRYPKPLVRLDLRKVEVDLGK